MNSLYKYRPASGLETTITAKLMYLVLLDAVDEDNSVVISQRKISEAVGINKSTVSHNLRRLERCGAINIYPTYTQYGGQNPNKYVVRERGIL